MKKRISLFIVSLLITVFSFAQNLDSLKSEIYSSEHAEDKFEMAYQFSRRTLFSNTNEALGVLHFVLKDTLEEVKTVDLAKCLNILGVYFYHTGVYDSSLVYASQAQRVLDALQDSTIWYPRNTMALAYRSLGEYEHALALFYEVIEMHKRNGETTQIPERLNDIGNLFTMKKNFKKGLEIQLQVLKDTDKNNVGFLGNVYNSIGVNYENLGMLDSAAFYYEKSLVAKEKGGNIYSIISSKLNLCGILDKGDQPELAIKCFEELLELQQNAKSNDKLSITFLNLAIANRKLDQYSKALNWLDSASVYIHKFDDPYLLKPLYTQYSRSFQETGRYKQAVLYKDSLIAINDSIYAKEKQKAIFELNTKYETEIKDEQINSLELENSVKQLKIENQRWLLLASSIFLVMLIGGVVFYVIYSRQKQSKEQALALMLLREEERARIASDMHDEIGSGLTRISFLSEQLKMNDDQKAEQTNGLSDKIITQSRTLSKNIKEIIWAVDPSNDKLSELIYYMRNFAMDFCEQTELKCEIHFPDDVDEENIEAQVRRNLYLLLKEALNNIAKYAKAQKVDVQLTIDGAFVSLFVEDNGIGFDQLLVKRGMGLSTMKKRCELLGGNFSLKSEVGNGTQLQFKNMKLFTTKM